MRASAKMAAVLLGLAYGGLADDEHTTTGGAVADLVAAADGQLQLDQSAASGDGFRGERVRFTGKTDRPPLSYRAGEKMRFVFSVAFNQKVPAGRVFFVHWYRKGDDEICRSGFERIEEGRPVVVETSIDRPGFVNVEATLVDVDGHSFAYFPDGSSRVGTRWNGGAGADVGKLLPSVPEPEDFDAFWAKHLAALEKLPLNVRYREVPAELVPEKFRGTRKVRVFSADCLGPRPCTASIAIPTDAKAKSLPIFASFDGYGEGPKGAPPDSWLYVDEPCVRVHVNAHGYELMREQAYYEEFFRANPHYAMGHDEYRNAETCYLYGMALRAVRALDVAKAQPEWDGREVRLVGSSQGGAQAIWAASLARCVTSARVSVTWMCDVGSVTAGRMRGMFPDYHGPMRYFDSVFHARRIPESCTVTISKAGLGDLTCPPAGQACLFNAINGPKSIDWIQNATHLFTPHESVREHEKTVRPAGEGVRTGDASALRRPRSVRAVKCAFDAKAWTIAADGQEPKPLDFRPRTNLRVAGGTPERKLPALSWVTVRGTLVAEADGEAVVGAGFDWWWECLVNGARVFGRLPSNGSTAHSGCLPTDWPFAVPVRKGANEVTFRVLLGGAGLASADALNGTVTVDDRFADAYRASLGRHETPGPAPAKAVRSGADKARFTTSQPYPAGLAFRTKGEKSWRETWDLRMTTNHVVTLPAGDWECELLEWRDDGQAWELLRRPCALTADDWVPVKAIPMNDDEAKVASYELPDVLVHTNGARVTRETWPQRRREMLDLLAREMVGAELPAPEALVVDKLEDKVALGGFAIRRQFRMYFRADRSGPYVDWLLYVPNRPMVRCAWGPKEPMYRPMKGVPVALMLNYDGNHIFSEDDRVPVATNAFNNDAKKGWRLAESDRGLGMRPESRSFVPLRLLMARGWAFLTACYVQVSADHYAHMHENVLSLWPDAKPGTLTSLSAWAWALSRGLDLAARQPEIDVGKSMVTGCSRLGKTALLAGARDERFAVVCPNQTGGGGIPLWKRNFGENVSMFFHDEARAWFVPSFRRYAGNEAAMPFDMHFLQACVAPRAFLAVGWTEFHFDPKGEFLAVKAASPAWELFGYRGMADAPEPVPYETNAVGDRIGYARRGGDHCISVLNWLWMLDFADRQFGT